MKKILTDDEISTIRSKSLYWNEVIKRLESHQILDHELADVVRELGVKILFILADYAEIFGKKEENEAEKTG